MIATFQHNISQHCWPSISKLPPNDRNIWTQHCCTGLAKRVQHHASSTNVAWKIWPLWNLSQQHPICCNMSQQGRQTHATCSYQRRRDIFCWNVVLDFRASLESDLPYSPIRNEFKAWTLLFLFPITKHLSLIAYFGKRTSRSSLMLMQASKPKLTFECYLFQIWQI